MEEKNQMMNKKTIKEDFIPQITASEIEEYENKFRELVSTSVEFNKDNGKHSMKIYSGESGVDAIWSGFIRLKGEDIINWFFSLQEGPFVKAKIHLDNDNYNIISKIYDFYKIWKEEWSKALTISSKPETEQEEEETSLQESIRTTSGIINNHSERMRKLAGL